MCQNINIATLKKMLSVFFFEIIATTIAATASSLLTILSVEIEIKEFK